MKKALRYGAVATLPFLLIMIFLILIITSSATAATGGVGDDNTMSNQLKDTEEYQLCISLQNEYQVEMHLLYSLYLLAPRNSFSDEDVRNVAIWIAENNASEEQVAEYYISTEPYKSIIKNKSKKEVQDTFESAKSIIGLDGENTAMSGNASNVEANLDGDAYQKDNPFTQAGYRGQCTWYCWGRVYETVGKRMPTGNAQNWYSTTQFKKGTEPKIGAVAVFSGGAFGHVAFIEKIENGKITYSEGNYNNPYANTNYAVIYASTHYKELTHTATIDSYLFPYVNVASGLRLVGYIYP